MRCTHGGAEYILFLHIIKSNKHILMAFNEVITDVLANGWKRLPALPHFRCSFCDHSQIRDTVWSSHFNTSSSLIRVYFVSLLAVNKSIAIVTVHVLCAALHLEKTFTTFQLLNSPGFPPVPFLLLPLIQSTSLLVHFSCPRSTQSTFPSSSLPQTRRSSSLLD